MSDENLELVRGIYERWQRGDFTSVEWADSEIEFSAVGTLDDRVHVGVKAMGEAWADWLSAFEGFRVGTPELHASGDQVVATNTFEGRGHTSGAPIPGLDRNATRWKLRDGKVTRLTIYSDPERALREAGIEP